MLPIFNGSIILLEILVPFVTGLAFLIPQANKGKQWIIVITAIFLIPSSLLLQNLGTFSYSPNNLIQGFLIILDFTLLGYFLLIGVKNRNYLVSLLTILQAVPLVYFELIGGLHHSDPIFIVDGLSSMLGLIINIIGPIVCIYSLNYMNEHEKHLNVQKSRQPRFFFFMLILLGAMNGIVLSNNIFWLYVFWEVTTLCCYELINHDGTKKSKENALRALWMNLIGGVAFVAVIFLSYFTYGSISLDVLLSRMPTPILLLSISLLAIAGFTKSAQLPFHKWLIGAMVAPTPVSALLHSSTMVNAGVYLILRIVPTLTGSSLSWVITVVGAFTFTVAAVQAINQNVSKQVLAYSTISNLGLIILCAGINTGLGYAAALTLLIFHSVSKGMLFMSAGIIENRLHSRNIDDWEGLLWRLPFTTVVMLIGMTSMFLPPFGMLIGKWVSVSAIVSAPLQFSLPLAILVVIGSGATTFYYSKWMGYLTTQPAQGVKMKWEKLPKLYTGVLIVLLVIALTISIGAGVLVNYIVSPIIEVVYSVQMSTPLYSIVTGLGSYPVGSLWLTIIIVASLGVILLRSKGGVLSPAYLSGENSSDQSVSFMSTADSEVKTSQQGVYLSEEIKADWFESFTSFVGKVLIIMMFLGVFY